MVWIPGLFGTLLFVTLMLRWLPAALSKSHDPFGTGQVFAGDLILAWKSFLRCAVAYVITAISLDWLPLIRWRTALAISAIALLGELLTELVAAEVFGDNAGLAVQLTAAAIAYSATMLGSISILQHHSRSAT
jgi:hypothetical protein